MKRRIFINRLIHTSGGLVLLPSLSLLNSCGYSPEIRTKLSEIDIPFLDEIGETIIPSTVGIPGAKEAKIGAYIILMIQDCYEQKEQEIFLNGVNSIHSLCANQYKNSFINLTAVQKKEVLEQIKTESIAYKKNESSKEHKFPHYFEMFKSLTISGYFSSEIGMTKARSYLPIPGRYESCIPMEKGNRPWAM